MKRYGTILRFAPGVRKDQAQTALEEFDRQNPGLLARDHMPRSQELNELGIRFPFRLETWDDRDGGGPVFYLP